MRDGLRETEIGGEHGEDAVRRRVGFPAQQRLRKGAEPAIRLRRRPHLVLLRALATVLSCVALCSAAILTPAPAAAVPLVALICVGGPVFASWEVPVALASLRAERGRKADVSVGGFGFAARL